VRRHGHAELLGKVWLFERCTKKEIDAIANVASQLELPAGKVLTRQGEHGHAFFVLVHGHAEVRREDAVIATLGPGNFFGEMSLLEDLPRAATVTTTEPATLLAIHAKDFNELVTTVPSVGHKMLTVLAQRLRELEDRYVPEYERLISTP
jgi:CRP-like cAMP-binding protein